MYTHVHYVASTQVSLVPCGPPLSEELRLHCSHIIRGEAWMIIFKVVGTTV